MTRPLGVWSPGAGASVASGKARCSRVGWSVRLSPGTSLGAPVMGALRAWSLSGECWAGTAAGKGRRCGREPAAHGAQVLPSLLESVPAEICGDHHFLFFLPFPVWPPLPCWPSSGRLPSPTPPPWVISSSARKSPETSRSRALCAPRRRAAPLCPAWPAPVGGFLETPGGGGVPGWLSVRLAGTSHVWR